MKKLDKKGIGTLELILLFFLVIAIAGVGYYVYKAKKNTDSTYSNAANASTATKQTTKPSYSTPTQIANAYDNSGWKKYCNSTNRECFYYPSNWKITDNPYEQVFDSPTVNQWYGVEVNYISKVSSSDTDETPPKTSFQVVDIEPLLVTDQQLSVVSGYYPSNNEPFYAIVNSSQIQQYQFQKGAISQNVPPALDYIGKFSQSKSRLESLYEHDPGQRTVQQAKDWFNSDDAATTLKMMQSFYYEQ